MRIGFLGPQGTFSEEAAETYRASLGGSAAAHELVPLSSNGEVIAAVAEGRVDEGVVAIENSIEGPVNVTLDMLAGDVDLLIKGEILVPIIQNLLVREQAATSGTGAAARSITKILSHPQAVGQCTTFLSRHFPSVPVQYASSTALAAQTVAETGEPWAAIASVAAARRYGLSVLLPSIQDKDNNVTRFVVLSRDQDGPNTGKCKTSIVFATEHVPGSLYRALGVLNLWDLNLTKIESRPAKNRLGNYIFFVDIEGHREDENIRDALTMLKKKTFYFKILGSYPSA